MGLSAVLLSTVMQLPALPNQRDESRPKRPRYRPPIGIPIREEGKTAGALISILLHVLIVALLLAPPLLIARQIQVSNEGAGGPGPVGGGGGGTRGTGGENARERLRFIRVAPIPAAPQPKLEPQPVPVVPKVEPPKPKPLEPIPPTPELKPAAPATANTDPSKVAGVGGGSGNDGTAGSGPGTGGGVGSGNGTGRGSGNGPGTGGGNAEIFPPTVVALTILPIPVPSKVRPYTLVAYFDVDTLGNATLLSFNPSKDGGYNKRIREMLSEIRFRPAVRADGRPVRDTAQISAIAP